MRCGLLRITAKSQGTRTDEQVVRICAGCRAAGCGTPRVLADGQETRIFAHQHDRAHEFGLREIGMVFTEEKGPTLKGPERKVRAHGVV